MLLVTHNGFEDHLQQLDQVLSRLRDNNVQVHIEETFLASSSFDYLGYRLTHDGIKPQEKKIKAILGVVNVTLLRKSKVDRTPITQYDWLADFLLYFFFPKSTKLKKYQKSMHF